MTWEEAYAATEGGTLQDASNPADTYFWMENVLSTARPKHKTQKSCITGLLANVNRLRDIPGQRMSKASHKLIDDLIAARGEAKAAAKAQAQLKAAGLGSQDKENVAAQANKRVFKNRGPKMPMPKLMEHLLAHDLVVTAKVAEGTGYSPAGLFKITGKMKKHFVPSATVGRRRRVSLESRKIMRERARKTPTDSVVYDDEYDRIALLEHQNSGCTQPFKLVSERSVRRMNAEDKDERSH